MRRGNLLTLRKFFNWNSSWYEKYQYQEFILRDLIFYVYLNSLFKILKIPTSIFKISHFSNNIVYIECDIYVRWTSRIIKHIKSFFYRYIYIWISFRQLFEKKRLLHSNILSFNHYYHNNTHIVYYNHFFKYSKQLLIRNSFIFLKCHKTDYFFKSHAYYINNSFIENKIVEYWMANIQNQYNYFTFILKHLYKLFLYNSKCLILTNYLSIVTYKTVSTSSWLYDVFYSQNIYFKKTSKMRGPLMSYKKTKSSKLIRSIEQLNHKLRRRNVYTKKQFDHKFRTSNVNSQNNLYPTFSRRNLYRNQQFRHKLIRNNFINYFNETVSLLNISDNLTKLPNMKFKPRVFPLLILGFFYNNTILNKLRFFIQYFKNRSSSWLLFFKQFVGIKKPRQLKFNLKLSNIILRYLVYRTKFHLKYNFPFYIWILESIFLYSQNSIMDKYSLLLNDFKLFSNSNNSGFRLNVLFKAIIYRLTRIQGYELLKNSFNLKSLYLYCTTSKNLRSMARLFKFHLLFEFFNNLNSKIEDTFFKYCNEISFFFFIPNLFLLYKPYITSAKLINDYVYFKLKNRFNLNKVYKSIKIWQLKERSLAFFKFKKLNLYQDIRRKHNDIWLRSQTHYFNRFVNLRTPLLGIRILLTGPPYKARRKVKKFYHLWVANHAITGNMPLQTFELMIDYHQTSITLRRATLGLKVWILFESYKELK